MEESIARHRRFAEDVSERADSPLAEGDGGSMRPAGLLVTGELSTRAMLMFAKRDDGPGSESGETGAIHHKWLGRRFVALRTTPSCPFCLKSARFCSCPSYAHAL